MGVPAYTRGITCTLRTLRTYTCPSMALAARVSLDFLLVEPDPDPRRTGRSDLCRAGVLSPLGPQHQRASSLQRQVWPGVRTIYRQHTCNFIPQCAGWTTATSFNGQQTAGDNLGPSVLGRQVQGLQPPSSHPLLLCTWNLGWGIGATGLRPHTPGPRLEEVAIACTLVSARQPAVP